MDEYIGIIKLFAGNYAPNDYLLCNGQTLQIASYQALYAVIGTAYGGDGRTTFALPDLRGRVPVRVGQAVPGGRIYSLGEKGGAEAIYVQPSNLPPFTLTNSSQINVAGSVSAKIQVRSEAGTIDNPANQYIAANDSGGLNFSDAADGHFLNDEAVQVTQNLNLPAGAVQVQSPGLALPISVSPPFTGLNYIICVNGLFPSRP